MLFVGYTSSGIGNRAQVIFSSSGKLTVPGGEQLAFPRCSPRLPRRH